MKKPLTNNHGFRLRLINDKRFSHFKLLAGWPVYFFLHFLTENMIPAEHCTPVHMWLDDLIPFNEWFLFFYVFWYGLIFFSLVFFLLYNVESFQKLQTYFIITQLTATMIYILFPSRQDLRPEVFPRENFLTDCVALLYRVDTNTGVCPSLHVACSLGIASVWMKEQSTKALWKVFIVLSVIGICLSTMFIKQHSAADFFAAIPVCLLAEWYLYGKEYWLPKLNPKSA